MMFENKTKEEIYLILLKEKEPLTDAGLLRCCALAVSKQLNISRNLASQYMNELFYEGILVKVGMKPTAFLLRSELEKVGIRVLDSSFDSLAELKASKIAPMEECEAFSELIGYDGSLNYEIEQCKAAVTYPGNGLPILFHGATGTGKSYIANLLFNYCQEKKLIDETHSLLTVNCAEYANNDEFFLTNLFGYKKGAYTGADKDNNGLLALANGGMLFFDEIHSLTPECQEKLFLFMDQGVYHMVGDNKKWFKSDVRFIFATTENPESSILKTLLRRIPITIKISSLKERPLLEKRKMIKKILENVAVKFQKEILISSTACQYLEQYEFIGNVGELKNCLQISVAHASLRADQAGDHINLSLNYLPVAIIKNRAEHAVVMEENQKMLTLEEILPKNAPDSQYLIFFKSIMQLYKQCIAGKMDDETFFNCVDMRIEQFVNCLFYEGNKKLSQREDIVASILSNFNHVFFKKYNFRELSNNEIHILTKYFTNLLENDKMFFIGLASEQDLFKKLDDKIKRDFPEKHEIAKQFVRTLQSNLNVKLEQFDVLMLFFFLHYFHRELQTYKIPVVILTHGYNIASGIAELANQLLYCQIFTAIDMPIESHFEQMTSRLKAYIDKLHNVKEVIVMVDMGSLEQFHNYIENFTDLDVGIINNVTTKLALDVGSMIMNDYPMQKILEEAKSRSEPNFVIVRKRNRPKAIFTVCASGYGIACKFATLLENSFPRKLDIDIIPVSSESLDFKGRTGLLEKYEVLMMIGTLESKNDEIPFLSIEDIINQQNVFGLSNLLTQLMSETELQIFNYNIIKNFSLDNLMDYLTILNPDKIIGSVEEIVNELQKRMSKQFTNSLIIGLYLHISCMIERLILNKQLSNYHDDSQFKSKHKEFIDMIQAVFEPLCQLYNVILPVEEIEYIHDYVYRQETVEEKHQSVEKKQKDLEKMMTEIGFTE